MDRHDIGMRKPSQDLRFTHKLLLQFLGPKPVPKCLEGHGSVNEGVVRFINAAGGANADRAYDLIASLCHVVVRDSSPLRGKRVISFATAEWALSPEKPQDGSTGHFFPGSWLSILIRWPSGQ
jgi:hypothetical protein